MYLDGAAGQTGRKIMLLYTDGGDTRSALRFGELLDLLKASDVTVYVDRPARAPDAIGSKAAQRPDPAADCRGDRRPGVLPAVGQEPRRGLRQGDGRDSRAVHARVPLDQHQGRTARGGRSRSRSSEKTAATHRVRSRKGYYALYKKP